MKTFHIKPLRDGERSASVVGYTYDELTRRTRTHYLGSVRVDADPAKPELALRLRPNAKLGDAKFELLPWHLRQIRDWLNEHGTFKKLQAAKFAREEAAERMAAEQAAAERAAISAEIRQELESSWRAEFEEAHRPLPVDPLVVLESHLVSAAEHLASEAERLRNLGIKLSSRRSANTDLSKCATSLDELQARANHIRVLLSGQFAESCKSAGLMTGRTKKEWQGTHLGGAPSKEALAAMRDEGVPTKSLHMAPELFTLNHEFRPTPFGNAATPPSPHQACRRNAKRRSFRGPQRLQATRTVPGGQHSPLGRTDA